MLEINMIYSDLSLTELAQINGGGIMSSVAGLVKDTWGTLYSTGRDFGRSVVNAVMP
ncbi:alcohol dehydrogenase [Streptococcus salivarius]|uniref:alcohol dehydrogenase n=1 Tax=Streptococcus salivarius TaxID=1304 RepID=UPI001898A9E0|nr:alcohol dehydrogenase [Streptococcus salivarius]